MGTYTQAGRKFRIETALGQDALLLERFTGEEALSTPFAFTLHMVSENPEIDPARLLRQPACISVALGDGSERKIHGRIRRFVQLGRSGLLTNYRAELVPWLWFLSLSSDCRIFQEQSVPEIVKTVFTDLGFTDFEDRLTGTYAPREYCVQYRETHLDFVSRLMEEEGIFYFFEHSGTKHTLVLADATTAVKPCPGQAKAYVDEQANRGKTEDVVRMVAVERTAATGKVALTDYNYLTPSAGLAASSAGDAPEEHYDFPGRYGTREDGERLARIELEAREVAGEVLEGEGTCRAFTSGYRFGLQDHYRRDLNRDYTLVRVRHDATSGGFGTNRGDDGDYTNSFVAIPHAVPFRPARRTPRPVVHGAQTAVVVGKQGEEIWVDKYGRVKVQFHWDRLGKKDEKSSCWVRVASTWAGKNWGFIQIPRIGQEVIVDFLEGDPDQPIITGRVYNAEQMPPYALPANQTQSGFKSRSSKQGGADNFNELRFEDKKGSEQVYLHAEKDWDTVVENDRTLQIGHDETITVKNDRKKTVEHDETTLVKNDRTETVEGKETVTVVKDRAHEVQANEKLTVAEKRETSIGSDEKLTVGAKRTTEIGADEKLSVGGGRTTEVQMSDKLTVNMSLDMEAMQSITLKANQEIKLQCGACSITLSPSGISIQGAPNVSIEAAAQLAMQAGAKVGIQAGGQLQAMAPMIMLN